ncbi:regulator of G-protein signaling 10 isoform X5 [Artibeus jamaicensis]|uniref:regulator of G-protein signaling 10 isoform X5 n=1 Tax=Artibeus jamaicensis TaxID=9417 RepID=UPI00235A8D0A|nr:regulator of G-protein signaling 10 isoform X5 [Artibeus jamaicensis]
MRPSPLSTSGRVTGWRGAADGDGHRKQRDQRLVTGQMQEKAKEIYMTFLSSKASSQVNVEGQSRLSEKILEEPHPLMFQKLQDQHDNRLVCALRRQASGGLTKLASSDMTVACPPPRSLREQFLSGSQVPGETQPLVISPNTVEMRQGPLDTSL